MNIPKDAIVKMKGLRPMIKEETIVASDDGRTEYIVYPDGSWRRIGPKKHKK